MEKVFKKDKKFYTIDEVLDKKIGKTWIVLDHNGTFRACEMRASLGNIKNFNFDFKEIYKSKIYKDELRKIKKEQCWKNCTHGCNIGLSIQYNKSSFFIVGVEAFKVILSRIKFGFLKRYYEEN